jgi:hypothetical protein
MIWRAMAFDAQMLIEHLNQEETAAYGNYNKELGEMNHNSVVYFSIGT